MSSLYGSANLKVRNGTISGSSPNLCETCRFSQTIQGRSTTTRLQFCSAAYPNQRINFEVVECSMYENKSLQELCELRRVAWYLVPTDLDGNLNFVPLHIFQKMNKSQSQQPECEEGAVPTACNNAVEEKV